MDISIVVPTFNEEAFLTLSIQSLLDQSFCFTELIIVDDGSTDRTVEIAQQFAAAHPNIHFVCASGTSVHAPGQKVVEAFNRGLVSLAKPWDVICKFDADILFPQNYLAELIRAFEQHPNLGMFGGQLIIKKKDIWTPEQIAFSNHVRGPIKAYSKSCFAAIGGVRATLGWDTLDELLAHYYGFAVLTNINLLAKHLRPTGQKYTSVRSKEKGIMFYGLGYGLLLGVLATFKWAFVQRGQLFSALAGFLGAWFSRKPMLVTKEQARFIRRYRWSAILNRFRT